MSKHSPTGHSHEKQSAFPLTAIQVTGATSLPVLNSSIQLFHQHGFAASFWILFLGNILIWLLAFAIVQMTANTTMNTLDNVRNYLGTIGSWTAGIVLLISTLAYYVTQTNLTTESILSLFPFKEGYAINQFFQFGVLLGIVSVLSIMQGINGLRWLAIISFPIITLAFLGLLFFIPTSSPITLTMPSSLGGLAIALGTSLSIAVDYPTFFQHSKSKKSSITAVTAIQAITFLIGVGGLYLGRYVAATENLSGWNIVINGALSVKILFFLMVVLSCLCVNTVNVYSASIAWELIAPNILLGKKEYTILGLGLTSIFILTTGIISVEFLLTLTDVPLGNLCLVLVFGYLGKLMVGELLGKDKLIFYFGWIIGSAITAIAGLQAEINVYFLLSGFTLSVTTVVLVFFLKKIKKELCNKIK